MLNNISINSVDNAQNSIAENKSSGDASEPRFDAELRQAQKELQQKKKPSNEPPMPYSPFGNIMQWDQHFSDVQLTGSDAFSNNYESENQLNEQVSPTEKGIEKNKTEDNNKYDLTILNKFSSRNIKSDWISQSLTNSFVPQFIIQMPENMPLNINSFANKLAEQIKACKMNFSSIKIALSPKDLGNINLTIKMVDGKVNISISVDLDQESFFKNNSNNLLKELEKLNISVGELSVSVNNHFQGSNREGTTKTFSTLSQIDNDNYEEMTPDQTCFFYKNNNLINHIT
ncbi:MAG: hypothetical protein DKM50_03135 [Candidatus Margulisiibacteriota bacterium]|nr:MAG: hypothetical protein A2X43_09760 [Candidatus Margulisbacteria bacterium GWD2_39_127]PZM83111.1 MAG: hypothetical protein DKM50_03135 [Candidatus Margulisiibacteriota bacterium]HAR62221.1 hypothetical protein [Candidatus Margulisiibacteriota bacterium]HCY36163.1 hypothetical protein [Candidatus Margulisiibacteriota bacterium]